MKKMLKIAVLLMALFLGINVVKADECDDYILYAGNNFLGYNDNYMNYQNSSYHYEKYTFKNRAGSSVVGFCRNVGWSAGKNNNNQIYKCKEALFDTADSSKSTKKLMYDAGIVAILRDGGSSDNENTATAVALRVYEMFWPEFNSNGRNKVKVHYAHQYYVNKWNDDEEIVKLLNETVGTVKKDYNTALEVKSFKGISGNILTDTIEKRAKELLIIGLKAAKNYKDNGSASIKHTETAMKTPNATNENGTITYKMSLVYNYNFSKFNKSTGAYAKFKFNCKNCAKNNVNYEIKVNDQTIQNETDLLDFLENGTGNVKVIVELTANSKNYSCEGLNYEVDLEYYDTSIANKVYDMYSNACSRSADCQHFYVLDSKNEAKHITLEDTIELCKDGASSNSSCSAHIGNDVCKDEETSTLVIKEGYTKSNACNTEASPNILSCIIGGKDASGNSFHEEEFETSYCSVWCKEDYHFTMPGNKELNSGRYFSLASQIKGTKTCYTSAINTSQFKKDLDEARERVIDAYNDYAVYKAASGKNGELKEDHKVKIYNLSWSCTQTVDSCENNKNSCINSCSVDCLNTGKPASVCASTCRTSCACNEMNDHPGCVSGKEITTEIAEITVNVYEFEFDFPEIYNYDGSLKNSYTSGNITCSGSKCKYRSIDTIECASTCKATSGGYICSSGSTCKKTQEAQPFSESSVSEKYNLFKNAYGVGSTSAGVFSENGKPITPPKSSGIPSNSFIGVIANYNYCSAWEMDYTFDPDMYFWYEDNYMNSVNTNKMETVGNIEVDNKQTELRCAGSVDNAYETCSSGWTSSYITSSEEMFVCTPNGECGKQTIQIAATSRMKASMNGKGSYITPTQFYTIYPSGAVVVAEEGTKIENGNELTNGLPVGLGTPAGVYNYTLIVENLGEYYNSDKLGRIWGDHDSVVAVTLEQNDNCIDNAAWKDTVTINGTYFDEGVYNCAYKVNCPDCPVVCDPTCKNPNCPENNCPTVCDPPCVYNNGADINYRPITPDDLNPNDRELGKNWKFDEKNITTALELKAYVTTHEIMDAGETIYDINYESTDNEFTMKVTMDSKMINKIRKYNDKYEDTLGYQNNTLKCYDHTNSNDGQVYKNVYCYSTFIDELLYDNDTKDNIKITPNGSRVIGSDEDDSDRLRKTNTQLSGYWTTWSEASLNKWSVTTEHGLAYYKTNYGAIGIGPSWK